MSGIPDLEDVSLGIARSAPAQVIPRVVRRRKGKYTNIEHVIGGSLDTSLQSGRAQARRERVPGSHVLWTKTFGCAHNVSDGEYMVGQLLSYGYSFTEHREDADLWLLNSCTVKDPSQAAFVNLLKAGRARRRPPRTPEEKQAVREAEEEETMEIVMFWRQRYVHWATQLLTHQRIEIRQMQPMLYLYCLICMKA